MTGRYRGLYDRCPSCNQLQFSFEEGVGWKCTNCGNTKR